VSLALVAGCGDPPAGDDDDDTSVDAGPTPDAGVADAAPLPDSSPDAMPGPDLTLNGPRAVADLAIDPQTFSAGDCELDPSEACVLAPGTRRVLRFAVETPNIGLEDLYLGTPGGGNPNFVYSPCHGHYHFEGYAVYTLQTPEGTPVAPGRKQAFCLLDWHKFLVDDPTVSDNGMYQCFDQGIQRGWSDVYETRLPCQFLDITDVPDGDYILKVELNVNRTLYEMSYDNNSIEIPVTIGDPTLLDPTEPCPPEVDNLSGDGDHRECGWDANTTLPCTPGAAVRAGCAPCTGGGASCTGDPVLRACDPDTGSCSTVNNLGQDDDACSTTCPRTAAFECPPSGMVDIYTAPLVMGAPYTCNVVVQ
jgi:hypothetical protein